jgi:hypothetical protein
MEAASASETSVNFYQTTRRNNPEDGHLYIRRRENLEPHIRSSFSTMKYADGQKTPLCLHNHRLVQSVRKRKANATCCVFDI